MGAGDGEAGAGDGEAEHRGPLPSETENTGRTGKKTRGKKTTTAGFRKTKPTILPKSLQTARTISIIREAAG